MAKGRRNTHTKSELRELILNEACAHMAEAGYTGYSTREVARRIGYSLGTIINVMGGNDLLIMEINTRTFGLWTEELEKALSDNPEDRIKALVHAYFDFAAKNRNLWSAIYEHKIPAVMKIPEDQTQLRGRLTSIVVKEVEKALPPDRFDDTELRNYTISLIQIVHGHCSWLISGSADLMGLKDVRSAALNRVQESLQFQKMLNI